MPHGRSASWPRTADGSRAEPASSRCGVPGRCASWPRRQCDPTTQVGFFGTSYEGEEKVKKLNAEMANGRLAMLGIAGAMFAEGQTGETLAQQFENLSFSIV